MNIIKIAQRNSNIELLRILCMVMIISEHLASYHNKGMSNGMDIPYTDIIRGFCTCAVNTFVIISGFFGIKFNLSRLLGICCKTWFYSVLGLLLSLLLGIHVFVPRTDFLDFLPVFSRRYWFITVYVVLYLLSPFLNQIAEKAKKGVLMKFLLLGGLLFYIWPTLCWVTNAPQLIPDAGYGIINFMYLYMLGRYLRLYAKPMGGVMKPLLLFLLSCTALCCSQTLLTELLGFRFTSFISYNTVFCLIASVGLFSLFLQFDFKSPFINSIAKGCLSVYLIHVFNVLKPIYVDILNDVHGMMLFVSIPLFACFIYLFCILADYVRDLMFIRIDQFILSHVEILLQKAYNYCVRNYC